MFLIVGMILIIPPSSAHNPSGNDEKMLRCDTQYASWEDMGIFMALITTCFDASVEGATFCVLWGSYASDPDHGACIHADDTGAYLCESTLTEYSYTTVHMMWCQGLTVGGTPPLPGTPPTDCLDLGVPPQVSPAPCTQYVLDYVSSMLSWINLDLVTPMHTPYPPTLDGASCLPLVYVNGEPVSLCWSQASEYVCAGVATPLRLVGACGNAHVDEEELMVCVSPWDEESRDAVCVPIQRGGGGGGGGGPCIGPNC